MSHMWGRQPEGHQLEIGVNEIEAHDNQNQSAGNVSNNNTHESNENWEKRYMDESHSLREHTKRSRSHFIDLICCNKWVSHHPDTHQTIGRRFFSAWAFRRKNKSKKGNAPACIVHVVQFTFPNFGQTMGALGNNGTISHQFLLLVGLAMATLGNETNTIHIHVTCRTVRPTISNEFHLVCELIGKRWRMASAFFALVTFSPLDDTLPPPPMPMKGNKIINWWNMSCTLHSATLFRAVITLSFI